ncbi:MAG: serine/threonine protein kinase [Pseudomonadota bacterium]
MSFTTYSRDAKADRVVLKTDLFGAVYRVHPSNSANGDTVIVRDLSTARWWLRPLARRLAAREARALAALPNSSALPSLLDWDGIRLTRSFVDGQPLQAAKPHDARYFKSARVLLRALHRAGVVHNDSAKEPNWLVRPDGTAGLVDFQLAGVFAQRTQWFRQLAMEDIRHLLKHKRSYVPHALTAREQRILATPAWHSRLWRQTGKRLYLFITRRLLKWRDREGANDRQL